MFFKIIGAMVTAAALAVLLLGGCEKSRRESDQPQTPPIQPSQERDAEIPDRERWLQKVARVLRGGQERLEPRLAA